MKGLKIAGIVIGAIALIVLIVWAIRRSMIGKDVKTGVANDVIEKAAIDSGIHPQVAQVVASAPDTAAALSSIGASMNVANAIANGNSVSPSFVASTNLGPVTTAFAGSFQSGDATLAAQVGYTGSLDFSDPTIINDPIYGKLTKGEINRIKFNEALKALGNK